MSFFYANDERKIDNSKNINVFKEQLLKDTYPLHYSRN